MTKEEKAMTIAHFGGDSLASMSELDMDIVRQVADEAVDPALLGTPFVSMDHRTGVYHVGKEKTELPDRQKILLDPLTAREGFMAFIRGQKLPEKKMAPVFTRDSVQAEDLPSIDSKYGWRKAGSIYGTLLGGPRSGKQVALEGMGTHFKMAFDDLMRSNPTNSVGIADAIVKESRLPPSERNVFPVVELTFRTYTPKGETEEKIAHQFVIVEFVNSARAQELNDAAVQEASEDVMASVEDDMSYTDEELAEALPVQEVEAVEEPIKRKPRRR
jgi:hypothetical protein